MPKVCEPCGFYSAENAPTACPQCGTGLKFTLLPPQGQAATAVADFGGHANTATTRARRQKESFLDSMGIDPKYIALGALILVGVVGFAVRQSQKRERLESVQAGMHISQAAKLLDTGKGTHHPRMVRLRDRFAPDDTSSGSIEHQDGGSHLVIHWENGVVTKVENRGSTGDGGMRRSRTVVTDPGAADADDDAGKKK
jgi:type II secretory pathway pseudopilin PulG